MNNKQEKIEEIYQIMNMHETNPYDTHFLMPYHFNTILMLYLQMPVA